MSGPTDVLPGSCNRQYGGQMKTQLSELRISEEYLPMERRTGSSQIQNPNKRVSNTSTRSFNQRKSQQHKRPSNGYLLQENAETLWRRSVLDWYPNLYTETYFLPPLHFNKVPYDIQTVAGQTVLLKRKASDQPFEPIVLPSCSSSPQSALLHVASRVWSNAPPGPLIRAFDMDAREDMALYMVLEYISELAKREGEVMLVISNLEFRRYLDDQVNPVNAAAIRLLPRPADLSSLEDIPVEITDHPNSCETSTQPSGECSAPSSQPSGGQSRPEQDKGENSAPSTLLNGGYSEAELSKQNLQKTRPNRCRPTKRQRNIHGGLQGDFDLLILNERYGIIVCEMKAVGADLNKTPDLDKSVVKAVEKAIKQLNKHERVLKYLVSDLVPVRIIKVLMLPNVTSSQLTAALSTNPIIQEAICVCLGVPDSDHAAAVSRCLCADDISNGTSSLWWQRTVTAHGPDRTMTQTVYERLVARFCGPATTIEVPTVTIPRRTVGLRTLSEATALTGLTMSMLTLYPEQVDLVSRPDPRVFLWGPPGTGKTVVLVLKALQWLNEGKNVHLLSSHRDSRAAILLIDHQLLYTRTDVTDTATWAQISTPAFPLSKPAKMLPRSASSLRPWCEVNNNYVALSTRTRAKRAKSPETPPRGGIFTHFFDFDNKPDDISKAVKELASASQKGELYVIADEAFRERHTTNGKFAEFCTELHREVPRLHLWAAGVLLDVVSSCLRKEKLTTPVRCPPAVIREVSKSGWFEGRQLLSYTSTPAPSPTDGPKVRWLPHWQEQTDSHRSAPLMGHWFDVPERCQCCAENIANLMRELRVAAVSGDQVLQCRDVFILCGNPRDDLPVVTTLPEHDLPVRVVKLDDDAAAINDVALAKSDAITVTHWRVVSGLERRVVVVLWSQPDEYYEVLLAFSRSTSFLACIGDSGQK